MKPKPKFSLLLLYAGFGLVTIGTVATFEEWYARAIGVGVVAILASLFFAVEEQ